MRIPRIETMFSPCYPPKSSSFGTFHADTPRVLHWQVPDRRAAHDLVRWKRSH